MELVDACVAAAPEPLGGELSEPAFDEIQLGAGGGREVQYEAWVGYQPALNRRGLVGRGVVEHDVHRKLAGHAGVDESAGQAAGSRLTVEWRAPQAGSVASPSGRSRPL